MANAVQITLDVLAGSTAEVPLKRHATAGYVWQVERAPPGVGDLQIVARPSADGAPGDATVEALWLRGTAPGEHEVVLILRRPWETTPAQELHILVRVR